ncbi:MAG: sulfate adenylyltransferase [Candidatus Thermoplasmatota archaeon]|nr:sulfate adenylyltransferase [Candidatus Thermoplasmatota archaeon]
MVSKPHGGKIVEIPEIHRESGNDGTTIDVDAGVASTVQLIRTGVYSPVEGFTGSEDLGSILSEQRLSNGIPWSVPLMLDSDRVTAKPGDYVFLRFRNRIIAEVKVEELLPYNKKETSKAIFGTLSPDHPGVRAMELRKDHLISGKLVCAADPRLPFGEYFRTPGETRKLFAEYGWKTISAFQTRNVPHLGHEFLQKSAMIRTDGLFINPVIGKKKPGDFADDLIISTYSHLIREYFPQNRVVLSTVNYEMQYAGPREALMHAIMRKNFGCTHFIMGRDHAGVGEFYGPYDAQRNVMQFEDLGIEVLPFEEAYYCSKCGWITVSGSCPHGGNDIQKFSATMIRSSLSNGRKQPRNIIRNDIWNMICDHPSPTVT